jgi:hypothetical protein
MGIWELLQNLMEYIGNKGTKPKKNPCSPFKKRKTGSFMSACVFKECKN